jgi:hypothetical protein
LAGTGFIIGWNWLYGISNIFEAYCTAVEYRAFEIRKVDIQKSREHI